MGKKCLLLVFILLLGVYSFGFAHEAANIFDVKSSDARVVVTETGSLAAPSSSSSGSSYTKNYAKTPVVTKRVLGSASKQKPSSSSPKGRAVNSKSPNFNRWIDDAISRYGDWNMPVLKNKYGETVTPRDYVKAIILIESSGVHRKSDGTLITSYCGAQGFMQLMPKTSKELGIADITDPAQNIMGGVKLFRQIFTSKYIGKKSGLEKIVMAGCAYNTGPYSKKLANSWESNVSRNVGAVSYGMKLKMCLGFKLTEQDKSYVSKHMTRGKSVDAYADSLYAYAKGMGM